MGYKKKIILFLQNFQKYLEFLDGGSVCYTNRLSHIFLCIQDTFVNRTFIVIFIVILYKHFLL